MIDLAEHVHRAFNDRAPLTVEGATVDKLRYGCPGWEGDETIVVFYEPAAALGCEVEVWARDHRGEPYLVLVRGYCDDRLIADIRDSDQRKQDVVAKVVAANAAREKAEQAKLREQLDDNAEKLQWALRRDQGQHFGGLTRTNLLNVEKGKA